MKARRHVSDEERRARLVARHHLGRTAASVEEAVRDLVAVHSSDPATPHLALRARVTGFAPADLDRALHEDRTLWRLHGMRRTLFVVARERAPVVLRACAEDVARAERRKTLGWVAASLEEQGDRVAADPEERLAALRSAVLDVLADGQPRSTRALTAAVEGLNLHLRVGSGRWTATTSLASRLLFLLALDGEVVRAASGGSWLASQYAWARRTTWFGAADPLAAPLPDERRARCDLVTAYLRAHGPATTADVRWWTGWTARATAAALDDAGAVPVTLDGGDAWLAAEDDADQAPAPPEVALLPALDPTTMGWKARDWYLGDHGPALFDRNGNAGPTIWVGGRVVGGWGQRRDAQVVVQLLEDVGSAGAAAVDAEARALTDWFEGVVAIPRFRTPLERRLRG